MDYAFIKKIRWIGIGFIWIGALFSAWACLMLGITVWIGTYLYTYSLLERSFFDAAKKYQDKSKSEAE